MRRLAWSDYHTYFVLPIKTQNPSGAIWVHNNDKCLGDGDDIGSPTSDQLSPAGGKKAADSSKNEKHGDGGRAL